MKKIFNLIFLLLFLSFFPAFGEEIIPAAKFIYLNGDVRVLKAGTNKWIEAAENLDLKAGDQIQVEADSQAIILLWDKSSLNLGENTKITLVNFNQPEKNIATKFKLFFGKVWADLEKFLNTNSSFEVETPHALAAVRGTSFEMEADGDSTTLNVWEGAVNYTKNNGKTEKVSQDFSVKSAPNKPYLAYPLTKFNRQNPNSWQKWNLLVRPKLKEERQKLPAFINFKNKSAFEKLKTLRHRLKNLPPIKKQEIINKIKNLPKVHREKILKKKLEHPKENLENKIQKFMRKAKNLPQNKQEKIIKRMLQHPVQNPEIKKQEMMHKIKNLPPKMQEKIIKRIHQYPVKNTKIHH